MFTIGDIVVLKEGAPVEIPDEHKGKAFRIIHTNGSKAFLAIDDQYDTLHLQCDMVNLEFKPRPPRVDIRPS